METAAGVKEIIQVMSDSRFLIKTSAAWPQQARAYWLQLRTVPVPVVAVTAEPDIEPQRSFLLLVTVFATGILPIANTTMCRCLYTAAWVWVQLTFNSMLSEEPLVMIWTISTETCSQEASVTCSREPPGIL